MDLQRLPGAAHVPGRSAGARAVTVRVPDASAAIVVGMDRLVLPQSLRDEIVAHARAETPKECCGLIAGRGDRATRVIRCTNASATPEVRYALKELRSVIEIEDAGDELVAIYHSHPRSPAYPSPTDRREAHWPEACYVLVSLRYDRPVPGGKGPFGPELHGFDICDRDTVREIPLDLP